jgi:hypothetical protein
MGARRFIARVLAGLTCAAPASALAHAGERALVLLLPTGHAILGGTLAVAATFLALLAVPDAAIRRLFGARRAIAAVPGWLPTVSSACSFGILVLLVAAGFTGTRDPLENPLPLAVWTLWWGGLTAAHALLGNLWAALNPWRAPYRMLRRLLHVEASPLTYPGWLGRWPAVALFLAFAWFELIDPAPDDPERLAVAVSVYAGVTLAGMLLFGERAWLERAEAFAVFFRFIALLAPLQADRQRRLHMTPPGTALARTEPLSLDATLFVLLTLATVSFDGLSKTFWWLGLGGINPLEFPGRTAVMGRNSLGLVSTWAALASAYALAVWLGGRLAGSRLPAPSLLGGFVLSILPISIAYHIAHYLPAFLVNAQYALAALGDPFSKGWNLLGLAERPVHTSFLSDYHSVAVLWFAEAAIVVLGHILAVLVAHAQAVERFGGGRAAPASQLPLALLMIGYTAFGLWLLAAPTAG